MHIWARVETIALTWRQTAPTSNATDPQKLWKEVPISADAHRQPTVEGRNAFLRDALPVGLACLQGIAVSSLFVVDVWIDPRLQTRSAVFTPGCLYRSAGPINFAGGGDGEDGPDVSLLADSQSQAPVRFGFHLLFFLSSMITVLESIADGFDLTSAGIS